MSPEHNEEEQLGNDSNSSHSGDERAAARKVIKVRPLSWRSDRFKAMLESLERKQIRKLSEKARSMLKKRLVGETLVVETSYRCAGLVGEKLDLI